MQISIEEIEQLLSFTFSNSFREFWNENVPDKSLPFSIEKTELSVGRFAEVGPHPEYGWLIKIRNVLPLDKLGIEIGIAHEIMHLVLYREGFPGVSFIGDETNEIGWGVIMDAVQSILTHPIISHRMKENWGLPLDDYIGIEVDETIQVIRGAEINHPLGFLERLSWLLTYIHNRIDNVDIICDEIAIRVPFIAESAQDYLDLMFSYGYSESGNLTPAIVVEVGNTLIKRLGINNYCSLSTLTENGTWGPA
jgi:hypothetical protein